MKRFIFLEVYIERKNKTEKYITKHGMENHSVLSGKERSKILYLTYCNWYREIKLIFKVHRILMKPKNKKLLRETEISKLSISYQFK